MIAGTAPCALFHDETIIQQPADLTQLTQTFMNGAESFIKSSAGWLYICVQMSLL